MNKLKIKKLKNENLKLENENKELKAKITLIKKEILDFNCKTNNLLR